MKQLRIALTAKTQALASRSKTAVMTASAGGLVLASGIASADTAAAVDSALAEGLALVGKIGPGVMLMVATVTGIGLVIGFLRR